MPHPQRADLDALIQPLIGADIEFIVVGGAAAVLHGAPITTQDLDIVHRRTSENVDRLLRLLQRLDATFRGRDIRPSAELLAGKGQLNLTTILGPLDRFASCMTAEATTSFFRTPRFSPMAHPAFASSISRL